MSRRLPTEPLERHGKLCSHGFAASLPRSPVRDGLPERTQHNRLASGMGDRGR